MRLNQPLLFSNHFNSIIMHQRSQFHSSFHSLPTLFFHSTQSTARSFFQHTYILSLSLFSHCLLYASCYPLLCEAYRCSLAWCYVTRRIRCERNVKKVWVVMRMHAYNLKEKTGERVTEQPNGFPFIIIFDFIFLGFGLEIRLCVLFSFLFHSLSNKICCVSFRSVRAHRI